ncbi:aminoacyl-tRNA hydrolase [Coxiella endosymbiont of Amblyomma americanum]|uniref:aminoacyl-tRNA hydrolase n=1 Tax=Coxiella endosymbiont of Amblyomma americanum TaxID=325775 RepID=UPI00057F01C9|nr:aminoacyl-tRNA hydrolase [Coxiella endosymbiont of Amblyomma americanum]AUJ58560.1 aminoacyl-tRNA hydrolase [Coxiella-like endosymbiont of Amblyomma americanum]
MRNEIKLIVGLGNPGDRYAKTRHNAGVWFIETLANQKQKLLYKESKLHYGFIGKWNHCWLFKPSTYMNESGLAVASVARFYKLIPKKILIIHDELDFSVGDVRLKKNGGHGGHNGLRSIIQYLGTTDFYRLRIGIGHPKSKDQVISYVLSSPSKEDYSAILMAIKRGISIIEKLVDKF